MQKHLYKGLFVLLKVVIYLKRAVVALFNALFDGLSAFFGAFFRVIGLRLFKFRLIAKKIAGHLNIPWDSRVMEIIGSRTLLQTGLLIIILFITVPQSKIYQVDAAQIPGIRHCSISWLVRANRIFFGRSCGRKPANIHSAN